MHAGQVLATLDRLNIEILGVAPLQLTVGNIFAQQFGDVIMNFTVRVLQQGFSAYEYFQTLFEASDLVAEGAGKQISWA